MTARKARRTVVEYNPDGWPNDNGWENRFNPGKRLCNSHLVRVCPGLPVWRTQTRGRGYISTGYYCETHLPDDARAVVDT